MQIHLTIIYYWVWLLMSYYLCYGWRTWHAMPVSRSWLHWYPLQSCWSQNNTHSAELHTHTIRALRQDEWCTVNAASILSVLQLSSVLVVSAPVWLIWYGPKMERFILYHLVVVWFTFALPKYKQISPGTSVIGRLMDSQVACLLDTVLVKCHLLRIQIGIWESKHPIPVPAASARHNRHDFGFCQ